jgi:hypothetical protein
VDNDLIWGAVCLTSECTGQLIAIEIIDDGKIDPKHSIIKRRAAVQSTQVAPTTLDQYDYSRHSLC